MKNVSKFKNPLLFISTLLAFVFLSSCQNGYNNRNETIITRTVKIYFVNNMTRIIQVKVPEYTTFSINESRGGYRLSYWTYCMGGVARCEETIINGVVYYEVLK